MKRVSAVQDNTPHAGPAEGRRGAGRRAINPIAVD